MKTEVAVVVAANALLLFLLVGGPLLRWLGWDS